MSLLYLLGTVHWDMKGPERIKKFLGFVRPTSIGIEASEELINQRLEERQIYKRVMEKQKSFDQLMQNFYLALGIEEPKSNIQLVFDFMVNQGYEIWATYEHKQHENQTANIYPVHNHEVLVRRSKQAWQEALGEASFDPNQGFSASFLDELECLDAQKLHDWIENSYSVEDLDVYKDPHCLELIRECDDAMEPRIRDIVSRNNGGIAVIIAGRAHFFGHYENNLYQRLSDLSPTRVSLPDVDKF
ncbi:MAG: hypothetical protein ACMXYG_07510 [Candidatus Woesearchaeota archaeon]